MFQGEVLEEDEKNLILMDRKLGRTTIDKNSIAARSDGKGINPEGREDE